MRFALSAEQHQFAAALDAALSKPVTWKQLVGLGIEDAAGTGPDLVVAFEALGRHAVPGPIIESFVVVPVSGIRSTVAWPPYVPYALDADTADRVLVIRDGIMHEGRIVGDALSSVDSSRRLFAVEAGRTLGPIEDSAFERGVLACSAQLIGLGRALLDKSTTYALQRKQFGQPIGSFQAVKHQLADVLVGLEMASPLVYGAAITLSAGDVSAAKVASSRAAYRAARVALQVHGAIGYTAEYDLSRWLTKVRALVTAWGTESFHRGRVMEALCG